MANTSTTKGCAGKKCSSTAMLEELVPPSGWDQDSNSHYLVLDLPAFKKEEVRLQVTNRDEIITSGERQTVGDKLVIRFLQTFKIPENSVPEKITGKFQGELLYVTVPKLKKDDSIEEISNILKLGKKPKNDDNIAKSSTMNSNDSDKNHCKIAEKVTFDGQGIITEDWNMGEEGSMLLQSVVKNLKENKGILITAVLAFSLGVLVSRRFSK